MLRAFRPLVALFAAVLSVAAEPAHLAALAKMPVKELTVFKDGHAFVLHQGLMPVDKDGNVIMDYLPSPVMGTFWPYSADKNAKLKAVTAGKRTIAIDKTALTLRELLEGNVGADLIVQETTGQPYPAKLVSFPTRSTEEVAATAAPGSPDPVAQKGNLVLLRTTEGTKVVDLSRVVDVKFTNGKYKTALAHEETRNLLTLSLDWNGNAPAKSAEVGMTYLQKGVRWIPQYRIELDDKGRAQVKLQATILNELVDLDNVTLNLVVGVPSFQFKDSTDPIALNQMVAALSPHFDRRSRTANGFSNAIMTQQVSRVQNMQGPEPGNTAVDLGPDLPGGRSEDLFIFTIKNVSLKRGERLVLPISQHSMPYKDVFVVEVASAPPLEVRRASGNDAAFAHLFNSPKAMHKIRLNNSGAQPLTTAPVVIIRNDRIVAQSLMTYCSPNGVVDVDVTTAVDVRVKKSDKETKRTPNAERWHNDALGKVELDGTITLVNFRNVPVEVEIVRHVLGHADAAEADGKVTMVNLLEDDENSPTVPSWWGNFNWPNGWSQFNGIGRITWNKKIEAGKKLELTYKWHYFAR